MAFWSGDGDGIYMTAQVPTGVALPAGFAMRPASGGDDDVIQFTYQTCNGTVCEAIAQIDPAFVDGTDTEDGQTMVASFRPGLTAEPFVFRFSADGLSQGLAALKPATTN
jgi:invasion protein IalB